MKNKQSNCWKVLKLIKPQHKDETSLSVKVTKVERILMRCDMVKS